MFSWQPFFAFCNYRAAHQLQSKVRSNGLGPYPPDVPLRV